MTDIDIRWKQRFANYRKAHARLKEAYAFYARSLGGNDEFVAMEAAVKCFELTFELAWQTMKDFITYQGYTGDIYGSRDSIRAALELGLIEDGEAWMDMITDRNRASHVYDEGNARYLTDRIAGRYNSEFVKFETKMDTLL